MTADKKGREGGKWSRYTSRDEWFEHVPFVYTLRYTYTSIHTDLLTDWRRNLQKNAKGLTGSQTEACWDGEIHVYITTKLIRVLATDQPDLVLM